MARRVQVLIGAQRLAHTFRDLGLRHSLEIGQLDGLALLGIELIERALHLPDEIEIEHFGRKIRKQRRMFGFVQLHGALGSAPWQRR